MTLLVLDTATDRCALGLSVNGRVVENTRSIPRAHNEHMLKMLDDLFAEAAVAPRDLSAIGFAAGPGSFTGIRISAAAAQALAVAAHALVLPVSSSRLLANAALRQLPGANRQPMVIGIQTVLRSRRNYVYLAGFSVVDAEAAAPRGLPNAQGAKTLLLESDDELLEDADLLARPVPEGWLRVMEGQDDATALDALAVDVAVGDLLALAQADLAAGLGLPPEGAQPRYVAGDTPWQPKTPAGHSPIE